MTQKKRKKQYLKILILLLVGNSVFYFSPTLAQSQLLSNIQITFCNTPIKQSELDMIVPGGKSQDLCVEITNTYSEDIPLSLEFLDSTITTDSLKNRACNASDRPKRQFGKFLLPYEKDIIVPAKSTIQKTYTIKYPAGFSGFSHGCLAYFIKNTDIGTTQDPIIIRLRGIKYIDLFVTEQRPLQAISLTKLPKIIETTENEYFITFEVSNKGNVDEYIHITSKLSNFLGYQKEFTFDAYIPAQSGHLFTTESFILPAYHGIFSFKNFIHYTPQFNFNITNGKHPTDIYHSGKITTYNILVLQTRQSGITLIVLGGISIIIIFNIIQSIKKRFKFTKKLEQIKTNKKNNYR